MVQLKNTKTGFVTKDIGTWDKNTYKADSWEEYRPQTQEPAIPSIAERHEASRIESPPNNIIKTSDLADNNVEELKTQSKLANDILVANPTDLQNYAKQGLKETDIRRDNGKIYIKSDSAFYGKMAPREVANTVSPTPDKTPETPTPEAPKTVLEQKDEFINNYRINKSSFREDAKEEAGVPEIQTAMNEAQEISNNYQTKVEQMTSDLELQDILNEEAKIALKDKIEGRTIAMSAINAQLTKGMSDLTQEQRIDRLYDVYELNTMINAYNAQNRTVKLLNGKYEQAMDNVRESVDDWAEEQRLKLQLLGEMGQLEKEDRVRAEAEIAIEQERMDAGYVYLDGSAYDKAVKDFNVDASTFNQFFYKDLSTGKIYLKPNGQQKTNKSVSNSEKTTTPTDKPMSTNQIEQFRRSYGWTPPFGFTQEQLLQYMKDNPNATPEELEAGAKQMSGGGAVTQAEQFLDEDYFRNNFTTEELKNMSDKLGTSKWYTGKTRDINRFIAEAQKRIETAREEGYSDEEILEFLKA
jgi:hypothetical protein